MGVETLSNTDPEATPLLRAEFGIESFVDRNAEGPHGRTSIQSALCYCYRLENDHDRVGV